MQILKKTISAAVAMVLVLCLLPMSAFAAENTEAYLQGQIDGGSKTIVLAEAVVLENDFTLPEDVTLTIQAGGSLTVPEGKKLTIRGNIAVEEGGALEVAGAYEMGKGVYVYQYYGKSCVINGVAEADQGIRFDVYSAEEVKNAVASMPSSAYGQYYILICESITLPCDITIPANAKLHMADKELTLTVPEGRTVVNYGEFRLDEKHTGNNYGTIDNYGLVDVSGKLYNYGTVYINKGCTTILRANGYVYNGGEAYVHMKAMANATLDGEWAYDEDKMELPFVTMNDKTEHKFRYDLGDVSHDGKINAKDSTLILQKVVGVLKDSAKFCETCADVSGDGKLNAKDSTLILQVVVGLRDSFPAQK